MANNCVRVWVVLIFLELYSCFQITVSHIRRRISWPGRDCPIVEFYRRNTRQARCFQGWRTAFKWHTTTRPPACLRAKIATTLIPMTMMIHQDPKPDQCQFLRCGQPRRRHLHLQLLAGRSLRHRRPQHQRQQHPPRRQRRRRRSLHLLSRKRSRLQGQRRVMTTVSIWLRLASETASAVFRRRTTRRRPAWHRREAAP